MFLNFFFLLLENLGAMAYPRYTGFREITDRDVLELHCIFIVPPYSKVCVKVISSTLMRMRRLI